MRPKEPSQTAFAVAGHRAVHQDLEKGKIFYDPLATRILGDNAHNVLADASKPESKKIRLFIATRSRFAEDALAAAVSQGVRQLVVLGAGLDTFAYRNPYSALH
ncbi:hypothetical protein HK096_009610, partial [Nowakowskiella sp. JEL0078]